MLLVHGLFAFALVIFGEALLFLAYNLLKTSSIE